MTTERTVCGRCHREIAPSRITGLGFDFNPHICPGMIVSGRVVDAALGFNLRPSKWMPGDQLLIIGAEGSAAIARNIGEDEE